MKTPLLTILCSGALVLSAFAQDPNATAPAASPALEAASSPSVAPTSAPAATRSPSKDDNSLESRIARKVRNRVNIQFGDDDNDRGDRHGSGSSDIDELGPIMAIPILGIIFTTMFGAPVLIVGVIMFFSYWKARSLHRTVRMMVEKGQPVPPELFAAPATPARARNDMRKGVVLAMVGLGVMVFLGAVAGWDEGVWALGLIPFLMGAGYLTIWKLEGQNTAALANTSSDNHSPVS
ncbi:MAG TPA: DUF6249 domain-containing protein [Chthoniobacterales bacterium]